jgi:hypothetical protein
MLGKAAAAFDADNAAAVTAEGVVTRQCVICPYRSRCAAAQAHAIPAAGTGGLDQTTLRSMTKAINALSTAALQAVVAFGELVHPVIELGVYSYDIANRTVHNPTLVVVGYIPDKRAREADVLSDKDIITRPTASRAKLNREKREAPAL